MTDHQYRVLHFTAPKEIRQLESQIEGAEATSWLPIHAVDRRADATGSPRKAG